MRKLIVFIYLFIFIGLTNPLWASGQEPVADVIKIMEGRYKVFITYDADITSIKVYDLSTILDKKNIKLALDELTKNSDVKYKKLRKDYYVLSKKYKKTSFNNYKLIKEEFLVKGIVLDENGLPLPGARIMIKGTTIGAITDLEGNFTLNSDIETGILVVSFVGYKTKELAFNADEEITVNLEIDNFNLDEIVVSGVADNTPSKKLTVTVVKIKGTTLNEVPASSAAGSLQGKIPGVMVKSAYGSPGSGATIRLRGSTSITGNQSPLIIVDGNMVETSLADINVDDIESLEVVKGAAAASLYGSKAGSGVIVITTKRGANLDKGSSQITLRNEFGVSALAKNIEQAEHHPYKLAADNDQYPYTKYEGVNYDEDGNVISGSRQLTEEQYADQPYAVINEHQNDFYSNGKYYTNYVGLAANQEKVNLFLSFENNKQSGIVFNTEGYQRKNFRFNADVKLTDKIKLSTSNLIITSKSDNPGSNTSFNDLLFLNPDVDLESLNADSSLYNIIPDPWSLEENPLYPLYYRSRKSDRNTVLSNLKLKYQITDWVYVNAKYTFEKQNKHWTTITPRGYLAGNGRTIAGSLYKEEYASTFQTIQTTANFDKTFNNFTVKGKLSYLYEDKNYSDMAITGREFIAAGIPQLINTNPEKATLNSYQGIIRSENIFGIVDFDFKSKYLFSALYRYDGSSLFGEDARWNPYFRVAGAYRITEEIDIPGVEEFKIRGAYGTSGQRPGFSNQYETWDIDDGVLSKSTLGNKDLKPSESKELELAFDLFLLKKIDLTGSYSTTTTENVLALAPLPAHLGYPNKWQNVGTLESNSLEFSLGYKVLSTNDFKWDIRFNFDRIRQQMVTLDIPEYQTGPNNAFLIRGDEVFGIMYGYKWLTSLDDMAKQLPEGATIDDYIINSDGYVIEAGTEGTIDEKAILLDADNDGVDDKVVIADGNHNFNLSFTSNLSYKGFSLYFLFDWKNGGDVYNYTRQYTYRDNRAIENDQYGKTDKKAITYYNNFYMGTTGSDYFVEDASYLKLRELSLYYNMNKAKLGGLSKWIESVRIGAIAHNVLTLTKYTGYDPEVASGTDLSNYAYDNFGYPNYRTITGSIEIKF
ncbi:MAG: SusC/RagA family TonB-linked outer membrane protein [Bacteroidota bacterium]